MSKKQALIISNEPWGKQKLSKHHYALALTRQRFDVFFLTPVISKKAKELCEDNSNIKLIYFYLSKTVNILRFHCRLLYKGFLKFSLNIFLKDYPTFDLVISFDCNGIFTNLSNFNGKYTIFFPVDQINERFRNEYIGFDELISISPVILDSFPAVKNQKLIHHGLSPEFIKNDLKFKDKVKIKTIGYIGNLLIGPVLDKSTLKK